MTQQTNSSMNRRKFLAMTAASTLMATGGANLFSTATAKSRRRLNVLFILVDDMGWGDLSIYGRPDFKTPNIDRLARQGTRFINAYSNQTVCTPTRVAFYTGRYPARLPIGLREPLSNITQAGSSVGLPPSHPTIASLLKGNGYETALVGKWHCGYPPNYSPLKSGFDEYLGNLSGGIDYFTHKDGRGVVDFYEGEEIADRAGYATDLYTERAVEFIQRDRSKPFYLSLHYNAPHWPWEGPEDEELSRTFYNSNAYTAGGSTEIYAAMVQRLDEGVGKVLEALEQSGQANNTLVIFTSDNGGERYSYFGPFQGRKGSLYEGGIRVPTLIRYPGVIRANQVSKQVIITHDLTATILAATRTSFDPDYPLDGVDLLPLLRDKRKVLPRTLFWRYGGAEPRTQKAVRNGDWKYLNLAGEEYLFDLSTDLGETVDLKDSHPEVFTRLRNQFEDWNSQVLPYGS
ncbi:sulfatase-like hydrolase/transferase [Scytonema hofmannii FACHB-248]|uniref:Sulfatase-like hydrolase/transferase n=1 Tax=Scytonema hofmannii FACHB-248 TaxID=1842502 RepID=A0ABR8GPI2_9CYAN|nr:MULTISPECIES: sulfatase-like hydrolase/transferase [Nostocales]MBD2604955.1 sulfatase-like hydrolase/transferase [Scytonema hofmannii FACHB-248]